MLGNSVSYLLSGYVVVRYSMSSTTPLVCPVNGAVAERWTSVVNPTRVVEVDVSFPVSSERGPPCFSSGCVLFVCLRYLFVGRSLGQVSVVFY